MSRNWYFEDHDENKAKDTKIMHWPNRLPDGVVNIIAHPDSDFRKGKDQIKNNKQNCWGHNLSNPKKNTILRAKESFLCCHTK